MAKQNRHTYLIIFIAFLTILMIGGICYFKMYYHWNVQLKPEIYEESNRKLINPNRGFYHIYGFNITDAESDYNAEVRKTVGTDASESLELIEINLQNYANGDISEKGLENIDELFQALQKQGKHYIVRFLYDWNGKSYDTEPQSIDTILKHMQQLKPILHTYKDEIYTLQGLFVGDCGEMHGSRYTDTDSMKKLFTQFVSVKDETTFMAVRTPQQWRNLGDTDAWESGKTISSLGLFNDGMLGSVYDYGTYGDQTKTEGGILERWTREEELQFQNALCKNVPNGGEVIVDNKYNDFDNALADLKTMHVTYLNRDYDANVLNKWADTTVSTGDCYDGMDGLSYMERHMGYRLLIKNVKMQQDFWEDTLEVSVTMQNVGFAPIYKPCEAKLTFYGEDGQKYDVKLKQTLSKLSGGNDAEKKQTLTAIIPLDKIEGGRSTAYFTLTDSASNLPILLANEQTYEDKGYEIGQVVVEK